MALHQIEWWLPYKFRSVCNLYREFITKCIFYVRNSVDIDTCVKQLVIYVIKMIIIKTNFKYCIYV